MEKADSDVVIVDSTSNDFLNHLAEQGDKPLMMLFKRLIGNDTKQNTVLTNAQIIDILQKEFNMDILYIHELEIDIYLNILKKFLKDWPQWDEFDCAINLLKNQKDYDNMKIMLESNYESLKTYLQKTLKSVEPLLRNTINEVKKATVKEQAVDDDVVMELQCTRQQLNHMFFRRPHPLHNMTIFNVEVPQSKIRLTAFPLEAMLNWPNTRIIININGTFVYRRTMVTTLKHVLVNKKLNYAEKPPEVLKTNFQMKGGKFTSTSRENFFAVIDEISRTRYTSEEIQEVIQAACTQVKSDLEGCPKKLDHPVMYRRCLAKSPYVRYLYSDVKSNSSFSVNNFDLQLEETAIPYVYLNFSRFQKSNDIPRNGEFLKVECTLCNERFVSTNILSRMKQHFEENHQGEADWSCTKCKLSFSMEKLTAMKWRHECIPMDTDES